MTAPKQPEAAALIERIHAIAARAERLCAGLNTADLTRQPAADAWSVGTVLEHLLIANGFYLDIIPEIAQRARARGTLATGAAWKHSFLGGMIERSLRPESTRRLKAPKIFRPGPAARPAVLAAFLAQQGQLERLLEETADLAWSRVGMASPVSPLIRTNLGDSFHIMVTHGERHMGQIERTRRALGLE